MHVWNPKRLLRAQRDRRQVRAYVDHLAGLPAVIDLRDLACSDCGDRERQKTVVPEGGAVCVDRAACQGSYGRAVTGPV